MAKVMRCACSRRQEGFRWFVQEVWTGSDGIERPMFEHQCPHFFRREDAERLARALADEKRQLEELRQRQREAFERYETDMRSWLQAQ